MMSYGPCGFCGFGADGCTSLDWDLIGIGSWSRKEEIDWHWIG